MPYEIFGASVILTVEITDVLGTNNYGTRAAPRPAEASINVDAAEVQT